MKGTLSRRAFVAASACALAAPALIGRAQAAAVLKISTSYPNDPKFSTARIWYDLFLPRLQAATGGAVTTQFFPDNQLGQEADVANQVKLGVVDVMLVGASIWTNLVPEFGVFDLGFLFQDYDHLLRATATPAGAGLQQLLVDKAGVHFPAWGRNIGARNFITKFAFTGPSDLAGHKIRCLPSPMVTETVRLMGAAATPMAFGEIYTALQAGVLDGLEHDPPTIVASKFYETAKFYTLTEHIFSPLGIFMSDATYRRVPAPLRDGFLASAKAAAIDTRVHGLAVATEALGVLKEQGVAVAECDKEAFRVRVQPLTDRFSKDHPEVKPVLDAIQATRT